MKTTKGPLLYEVPKFRVRCISGHKWTFSTFGLSSLISIIELYNDRCQRQRKWRIRFTDFGSQPRSQGPLLLGPRVGEDPGNEVVCQSGRPTHSWCNKNKLNKLTSVFHASVLLLIMNFVKTLSKYASRGFAVNLFFKV